MVPIHRQEMAPIWNERLCDTNSECCIDSVASNIPIFLHVKNTASARITTRVDLNLCQQRKRGS